MNDNSLLLAVHREFNLLLRDLALSSDITPFLANVIATVERFLPETKVSILTLNSECNTLHSGASNNLPAFYNEAIEGVEIGEMVGSCGAAAYLNTPIFVDNINTHPNWQPYLALTRQANLHACWSVPFTNSHNQVLGTFAIYHHEPKSPSEAELEIVNIAALVTSVAMEKAELESQLRFNAIHDALTGLHNRAYLNEAGENLISLCDRRNLDCSLLFIDLDKFKRVNDSLGHRAGDQLLVQVADIIKAQTRTSDIRARFGGDEFIVMMESSSQAHSEQVAQRIRQSLLESVSSEILELGFGISIGIARKTTQVETLDALILHADEAMYHAKQNHLGIFSKLV